MLCSRRRDYRIAMPQETHSNQLAQRASLKLVINVTKTPQCTHQSLRAYTKADLQAHGPSRN